MYFIMCDQDNSESLDRQELAAYFQMMDSGLMSKEQIKRYLMKVWDVEDD